MLRYLKKKVHGLAISPNFENGIAPPLGVLGQKFFGVLNNSLGGTSGPSMSKIGDVRVPNHFDPCWNCPNPYQTTLQMLSPLCCPLCVVRQHSRSNLSAEEKQEELSNLPICCVLTGFFYLSYGIIRGCYSIKWGEAILCICPHVFLWL